MTKSVIKGKVSICTTAYNRASFLRVLLSSILAQTYENFEVIITDNSEGNDTKEMLKEFSDSRIRYIKNASNIGMAANAIKNFSMVDGEYMTFTPDDDLWIDKNKLQMQIDFLQANPEINIVYSNATSISKEGTPLSDFDSVYGSDESAEAISGENLLPGYRTGYFLNIATAMLRVKPLLNILRESYHFGSEEYFCYYIAAVGQNIGFIYKKLIALRDAEHFRVVSDGGKLIDWKKKRRYRIKQIFSIYNTLIYFHPESAKKLSTPLVQNFLSDHVLRQASIRRPWLLLHTIGACYVMFSEFSLLKIFKIKKTNKKSFG